MLIPNHPDPERLSALASGETDATADASLSEHLSTCVRCTGLLEELGAIRMSLAELPDLIPHRPLRLLPEVADQPAAIDRLGGWARRVFAPVLTAGVALAMVGLIGTATPALNGISGSQSDALLDRGLESEPTVMAGAAEGESNATASDSSAPGDDQEYAAGEDDGSREETERLAVDQERSVWPMVLFGGVALMIAAALMRWILVPRAA